MSVVRGILINANIIGVYGGYGSEAIEVSIDMIGGYGVGYGDYVTDSGFVDVIHDS